MFPDIPPAGATIMALIGLNLGVYLLWKFPPAWKLLNRYFISVPLYPYPLSMIGSVFSHQLLKHFAINSAILWFIGTRSKPFHPKTASYLDGILTRAFSSR